MAVKFSQKIFDKICERISQGESLSSICSDEKMPSRDSVYKWMHENQDLTDKYARAREENPFSAGFSGGFPGLCS